MTKPAPSLSVRTITPRSSAKRTTADWCADAVKMCQTLDRRMKSEKGIDAAGELKLLLVRLGARRK